MMLQVQHVHGMSAAENRNRGGCACAASLHGVLWQLGTMFSLDQCKYSVLISTGDEGTHKGKLPLQFHEYQG